MLVISVVFFFFKQKTAYEMRISAWSSDVCSSDLPHGLPAQPHRGAEQRRGRATLRHFREDGRTAPGQGDLEVPRPGRGRWTLSVNSSMDPALDAIRPEAAAWFARPRDGALAPDEEETLEHWRRRAERLETPRRGKGCVRR